MSTVLWYQGKMYSDSQGTNNKTGEKDFDVKKMFRIGHKKYGLTGTLEGWQHFRHLVLEKNILKKIVYYILFFAHRYHQSSFVVCHNEEENTLTTYDHRWWGWKKHSFKTGRYSHAYMGSGTAFWDKKLVRLMKDGFLSPYDLMNVAISLDEYSGGDIVVL